MSKEFIARSKGKNGKAEQLYRDHAYGVYYLASSTAERISKKLPEETRKNFIETVKMASEYHDLGKLSPLNQNALFSGTFAKLPYDHWKDGAKFLFQLDLYSPSLIAISHHSCLDSENLRPDKGDGYEANPEFLDIHYEEFKKIKGFEKTETTHIKELDSAILYRMGLSSLVNGDWDDSTQAKGYTIPVCSETRWGERLKRFRERVTKITQDKELQINGLDAKDEVATFQKKRHKLRKNLWNRTKRINIEQDIAILSATVGMGKTFSFIQLALRKAMKQDAPHIFIVAPYNHIVDQLINVIRWAVKLEGEDSEDIVGNHTCTAVYENSDLQTKASRWRCPIIVTSSVQFFETLSSNVAGKLVKLAEVPNSIVVMDEWHSIMEEHLIEFYWQEINNLCKMFNTKFILSSGSMTRYWDSSFNGKFVSNNDVKIEEVTTKAFMKRSVKAEAGRVKYEHIGNLSADELEKDILNHNGKGKKTIVLLSTTKNVAVMAKKLINKGRNVYTVYGSLIDSDSGAHVAKIKGDDSDWIVICTTSIESGIDISSEVAYSVDRSIMSQVQLGGRVNREGLYKESKVLVFKEKIGEFNDNPSFQTPAEITKRLGLIERISDADQCTKEYLMELEMGGKKKEHKQILNNADKAKVFPEIAQRSRIINEGRGSVLVGPKAQDIFVRLTRKANGEDVNVSMKDIAKNSVPMPSKKDFDESEFEKVPGFSVKNSKDEEISTLMIYRGGYDPDYFGIWKNKI